MKYKTGTRHIMFFTVWHIKHLVNCQFYKMQDLRKGRMDKFIANEKYIAIITLYKPISHDSAAETRAEILVRF